MHAMIKIQSLGQIIQFLISFQLNFPKNTNQKAIITNQKMIKSKLR